MSFGYQDLACCARHGLEPEMEQVSSPDIAPFPFWLVPPGFRVARLSDVLRATGQPCRASDLSERKVAERAANLFQQLGIRYAPTVPLAGPWKGPLALWKKTGTDDYLVLWAVG